MNEENKKQKEIMTVGIQDITKEVARLIISRDDNNKLWTTTSSVQSSIFDQVSHIHVDDDSNDISSDIYSNSISYLLNDNDYIRSEIDRIKQRLSLLSNNDQLTQSINSQTQSAPTQPFTATIHRILHPYMTSYDRPHIAQQYIHPNYHNLFYSSLVFFVCPKVWA